MSIRSAAMRADAAGDSGRPGGRQIVSAWGPEVDAPAGDSRTAALIALSLCGVAAAGAGLVVAIGTAEAREWLGFSFVELPRRPGEVLSILVNNLALLAAIVVAGLIAQFERRLRSRGPGDAADRLARGVVRCLDVVVAGSATVHALIVGVGTGGYGGEMVAALLPHGPLELAAYSIAIALYVAARREPVAPGRWGLIGISVLLLVIAAPIEVYG
jgi:hypothetical protein